MKRVTKNLNPIYKDRKYYESVIKKYYEDEILRKQNEHEFAHNCKRYRIANLTIGDFPDPSEDLFTIADFREKSLLTQVIFEDTAVKREHYKDEETYKHNKFVENCYIPIGDTRMKDIIKTYDPDYYYEHFFICV